MKPDKLFCYFSPIILQIFGTLLYLLSCLIILTLAKKSNIIKVPPKL
nr:MAG TPA: hypothetical protein [Caudoviricetes sp.]